MIDLFAGFWGIVTGIVILIILGLLAVSNTQKGASYHFDAQGKKGAFENLLRAFIDISKFIVGLASGSIALIVGSSAFRPTGHLPPSFAAPLFLLVLSVIYGIGFMMFLTTDYGGISTSNQRIQPPKIL